MLESVDEAAAFHWPEGVEQDRMVMPGDNVEMICTLHNPLALENGVRFNIREGGRYASELVLYNIFYFSSSTPSQKILTWLTWYLFCKNQQDSSNRPCHPHHQIT